MAEIGNVNEVSKVLKWTIPQFFSLSEEAFIMVYSPCFSFAGELWFMSIYPNGSQYYPESLGHIGIYLSRYGSGQSISLEYSISLRTREGKKDKERYFSWNFIDRESGCGYFKFISRSELAKRKSELLPDGDLTVLCTIKHSRAKEDYSPPQKKTFWVATTIFVIAVLTACIYVNNKGSLPSTCVCTESPPQFDVIVRDIGSTYIEIHWDLPEELKINTERYNVYFRTSEVKWQEIVFPNASQTSYNLTNLDPGVPYHIYVMAMNTSGINKSSEKVIVRTSSEAISSPPLDLIVTNIGSTYIEIHWNLLEELKTSVAGLSILFRLSGLKWREITLHNVSDTFYNLTNLNPGVSYQIYVMAVDTSGISRSSAKVTVRTSSEVIQSSIHPDLIISDIGSSYIEIRWDVSEELKMNTARYSVFFRIRGAKWQEIVLLNVSQIFYNLTNLDPGVHYQIYVAAIDPSGIGKSSEKATVQTSVEAIYHDPPKSRLKQAISVATAIVIIVIATAWAYSNSETSLGYTNSYEEEAKIASKEGANNVKDDQTENTEIDESNNFSSNQSGTTEDESEEANIVSKEGANNVKDDQTENTEIDESNNFSSNQSGTIEDQESAPVIDFPDVDGCVSDINLILKDGGGIDVTFILETPSGKIKIPAHKLILSVMSPYFADKFYGEQINRERLDISLEGVNPNAFEEMIRFCYGNTPCLRTIEEVCALFKVSFQFKVISLLNICCTFFKHATIKPGNVFSVLEVSEEMEDNSLKDKCYKFLEDKTREVLVSYELRNVNPTMVHHVLNLPKMSLRCEYELIKWVFDWAKVQSEQNVSISQSTRNCLQQLLQKMNFLSLTVEEFATLCKDNTDFFSFDEMASISLNIGLPGSMEMPEWYNRDLVCRIYTGSKE